MYEIFEPNTFDINILYEYLVEMDKEYAPPISNLVDDMFGYALKICKNAYIIVAKDKKEVIGIYAIYINEKYSFMTTGSVKYHYRGKGIFKQLIQQGINLSKEKKVLYTELEVYAENERAVSIYTQNGYVLNSEDKDKKTMRLYL